MELTEQDLIDAREHEDYTQEEDAGHADGRIAEADATVDAEIAQAYPADKGPFVPDTEDKVNWLLGRIADRRARAARIRANAEKMARQEEAEVESLLWRFTPALIAYTRQALADGKRKSITSLAGTMGFRMKPASLSLTNEPEARAWVEANLPSALRVDVRTLAARLLKTGEVVEGTKLNRAEEVFFIK